MIARFKKAKGRPALAASLFAAVGLATLTDAQPGGKPPAQKDLIGTWVLAGKPGEVSETPASGGRLKFITGTHWAITQADPKTGVTIFHHGGTYALKGSEYLETAEYANQNTADLIGHTFKFTIKIEGDTLTQVGIGNPWTEVWKRLTNSTGGATMLDPANGLSVGSNLSAQPAPDPQAPPSIVATSPAIGATDVDPAITKITVTFDRDMGAGFSWTGGGPEHPVPPEGAKAHWSDARTCAYPVKLEAGHYYRVGINSKSY